MTAPRSLFVQPFAQLDGDRLVSHADQLKNSALVGVEVLQQQQLALINAGPIMRPRGVGLNPYSLLSQRQVLQLYAH